MKSKKTKIQLLSVVAIIAIGIVGAKIYDKDRAIIDPSPTIDFEAYVPNDQSELSVQQILLRMSITQSTADIMEFGLTEPSKHQERLMYYIQNFKNDILLISEGDTVPCIDSHFERTHMQSPSRKFVLNFSHNISEKDHLIIADKIFSGEILKLALAPPS